MALCDYILCKKCECKLVYDGGAENRKWFRERFGKELEIVCPDCEPKKLSYANIDVNKRKPMTKEEMLRIMRLLSGIESVLLTKEKTPDYLFEEITSAVAVLEREILL